MRPVLAAVFGFDLLDPGDDPVDALVVVEAVAAFDDDFGDLLARLRAGPA